MKIFENFANENMQTATSASLQRKQKHVNESPLLEIRISVSSRGLNTTIHLHVQQTGLNCSNPACKRRKIEEWKWTRTLMTLFPNQTGNKIKFIRGTVPNFLLFCTGLVEDGLPERYTESVRKLLPVDQVLLALQFFATGSFQSVVANVLKVSQQSVGHSIYDVATALCRIGPKHIFVDNTNLVSVSYIVTFT